MSTRVVGKGGLSQPECTYCTWFGSPSCCGRGPWLGVMSVRTCRGRGPPAAHAASTPPGHARARAAPTTALPLQGARRLQVDFHNAPQQRAQPRCTTSAERVCGTTFPDVAPTVASASMSISGSPCKRRPAPNPLTCHQKLDEGLSFVAPTRWMSGHCRCSSVPTGQNLAAAGQKANPSQPDNCRQCRHLSTPSVSRQATLPSTQCNTPHRQKAHSKP